MASAIRVEDEEAKRLIYRDTCRSIYNGFGVHSVRRVSEMVKFFVSMEGGVFPTKLNKEMFYVDGISKEIVISHNMESTRLSCEGFDASVFTEQELQTLNAVLAMAQPMNTKELIDKSHEEEAWLNHRDNNGLIPYSEAFTLH